MRFLAVLVLLLLAPFVGEYLLGNLPPDPPTRLIAFPPLALLYGGGALLIREITRRLGRGHPTMLLLAVGYALIEEGVVLNTLFNRDYLGLGLLEFGWSPALGTSPVWSTFVLGIHTVWSIVVPIVLTEHLFPGLRTTPWLRTPGLVIAALAYLLGAAVIGLGTFLTYDFLTPPAQLVAVIGLVLICCVLAVRLPRHHRSGSNGRPPPALGVGAAAFACGTGFVLTRLGPGADRLPPALSVIALLGCAVVAVLVLGRAARHQAWSSTHRLAVASGVIGSYMIAGFAVQFSIYGITTAGLIGQLGCVAAIGGIIARCWQLRRRHRERESSRLSRPAL